MNIVAQNRKARYEYSILDTFEAGIALKGTEVKSLRDGKGNIAESFVEVKNNEAFLINAYIPEYSKARMFNHFPRAPRKLLLHKKEIRKIETQIKLKGLTVVALKLYFNRKNKAKVEIAVARGKKKHDKREAIKEREFERRKAKKDFL